MCWNTRLADCYVQTKSGSRFYTNALAFLSHSNTAASQSRSTIEDEDRTLLSQDDYRRLMRQACLLLVVQGIGDGSGLLASRLWSVTILNLFILELSSLWAL